MKRTTALLICLFLLLLSGCSEAELPEQTTEATIAATQPMYMQTEPAETVYQTLPAPTQAAPAESLPTEPMPTQPLQPYVQNGIPELYNLEELRSYLYQQLDLGAEKLDLRYCGERGELNAETIARIGSLLYVECVPDGELYHLTLWEYPGQRMVRAHQSGNWGILSEDEKLALQAALDMVAQAQANSPSKLELEIQLFDLLRQKVSYNSGTTEITDPDQPPRYLTAVGALVDGSANCQGYVDGFYVLASLAGFPCDKMHVDIPNGGHVVNVIELDGSWYLVDATFNDNGDPSGVQVSYRLFNAGVDKCTEYTWENVMERHTLARESDEHYYYYAYHDDLTKAFYDLNSMAADVLDEWQSRGTGKRFLMLQGANASWSSLADALNRAANERGIYIRYHIWAETNRSDTFFYVELE